jgi:DNA invertase Pin-like site-specific DNA recombinase
MILELKVKRAALYARVSTIGQGQDPELQLRELREHCVKQGIAVAETYVDQVSSAKVRPNLERLLKDAESTDRAFDAVIVWKFDRVARSSLELCTILERLQRVNVSFTSLTEQIDTGTAAGKLVFTVLGAVAEMERSLIRERVRAGLRLARSKGKVLGRPSLNIAPTTVALSVENHGGSLLLAARALGISYALAYALYKKTPGYKARKRAMTASPGVRRRTKEASCST